VKAAEPAGVGPAADQAPVRSWIDGEPRLGAAGLAMLRRLGQRAGFTWPRWVVLAVLLSAALAARRFRANGPYDVTSIVRVTEGRVEVAGAQLSAAVLRAHVQDLAFTSARLKALMAHYPGHFPGLGLDPATTLENFRSQLEVTITETDFTEERKVDDPPRSARLTINFTGNDPDFVWKVTQELSQLVIDSSRGQQRANLEAAKTVADNALRRATDELVAVEAENLPPRSPRLEGAQGRLTLAAMEAHKTDLALKALQEDEALRFEIVDPGRKPRIPNKLVDAVTGFVVGLGSFLVLGWLVVGAFDPRVLDAQDLASMGSNVLGQVPAFSGDGPTPRRRSPDFPTTAP
jgi:hypothetical protein